MSPGTASVDLAAMAPPIRGGAAPAPAIATGLAAALGLVLPAMARAGPLSRALDNLAAHQDRSAAASPRAAGPIRSSPRGPRWRCPPRARTRRRGARGTHRSATRWPARSAAHARRRRAHGRGGDRGGARSAEVGGRNLVREVLAGQAADGAIGDGPSTTAWASSRCGPAGSPPAPSRCAARGAPRAPAARGRGGRPTPARWDATQHHLGRRPGAGRGRPAARALVLAAAGARVPAARAEPRRRLPGGGRRGEHGPDDRVGDRRAAHARRPAGPAPWNRAGGPVRLPAAAPATRRRRANSRESPAPSVWATSQAALAFAPGPLPLWPRGRAPTPPRTPKAVLREPPGEAWWCATATTRAGRASTRRRCACRVGGRDVTDEARVTGRILKLPPRRVPAGRSTVALTVADRAGNARAVTGASSPGDR